MMTITDWLMIVVQSQVDEDEFALLYELIAAGAVTGLTKKTFFGGSARKKSKKLIAATMEVHARHRGGQKVGNGCRATNLTPFAARSQMPSLLPLHGVLRAAALEALC